MEGGPQKIFARPVVEHTCSPGACDCEELGSRNPWPPLELADSLSALTDEEAATIFELLAISHARRAIRAEFPDPEPA